MSATQAYAELMRHYGELEDLKFTSAALAWDQETGMPPRGTASRARQLATLAGILHERSTQPRVLELLETCESEAEQFGPPQRSALVELRRELDEATKIPATLVKELAEAQSLGLEAWRQARAAADFAQFAPHLQRILDLTRSKAAALDPAAPAYDVLLDHHERGATMEWTARLFEELQVGLRPLVEAVLERQDSVDARCAQVEWDLDQQARFGIRVIEAMGFDLEAGRVDNSAHPFCTTLGRGDVRLTRRFLPTDLRPALYGIIHEAGHGLYEQGLPEALSGTPLCDAVSMGIHESQSRLWENVVGRSRPFWQYFLPRLQKEFPGPFNQVDVDQMYQAVNQVEASFIRVEADELTYNLHVILRFELEKALFAGDLSLEEIPAAWNAKMQQSLGRTPGDDSEGCLQDIHWAMGAFGYFPTYTLGNIYCSQFYLSAREQLPGLEEGIARGEFQPLLQWLRDNIHQHGKLYSPLELVTRVSGSAPTPGPLLDYLRSKYETLYGLR
jgi:carboxypeptidase Taq